MRVKKLKDESKSKEDSNSFLKRLITQERSLIDLKEKLSKLSMIHE
jgi:hypothetical protein